MMVRKQPRTLLQDNLLWVSYHHFIFSSENPQLRVTSGADARKTVLSSVYIWPNNILKEFESFLIP